MPAEALLDGPPADRPLRDAARLLRGPAVRTLVAARFVSLAGASGAPVALAFGVLRLPGAGPTGLGVVLAATALARAAFLVLGGVVADRAGRRRLMVLAESAAGLLTVATAVLLATGAGVPVLAGAGALSGVAQALFFPAFAGFVPEIARPHELRAVNALLRLANNVATAVGTAAGGAAVALVGPAPALAAGGVGLLLAAGLVATIHRPGDVARPEGSEGIEGPERRASLLADLRAGWWEFRSRRWVVVVVTLGAVTNLGLGAVFGVLGPVRAARDLGGPGAWAAVTAAYAVGTLPGVLLVLRLRPRRPLALAVVAGAGPALPVVGLAAALPLGVIALLALLGGVCLDILVVLWDTALQQNVPGEALSRVSAFDWFGTFGLAPLAFALAGPLVGAVGLSAALWIAAVLTATFPLALLDPQVRRLGAVTGPSVGPGLEGARGGSA